MALQPKKIVRESKSPPKADKKPNFRIEEIHIEKGDIVEITPDMIIGDVVIAYPETLQVFQKAGIHCVGCYASTFESIQEGIARHGLDPIKICEELNRKIQEKK